MMKWSAKLRVLVVIALMAVGLTMAVPVGGASAGTKCGTTGCSRSTNHSSAGFFARHNWTCDSGSTGTASTGCYGGDTYWVSPGYGTPAGQDWDVIQVDGGWCFKIHFVNFYGKSWSVTYNRLGTSNQYVKIENGSVGDVTYQSSSSC